MTAISESPERLHFWENPWTWACFFATAALLGLWLAEGKYGSRQAQIERQYQARQLHGQSVKPPGEREALSTPEETFIGLGPLYLVFGAALAISWVALLGTHFGLLRVLGGPIDGEPTPATGDVSSSNHLQAR